MAFGRNLLVLVCLFLLPFVQCSVDITREPETNGTIVVQDCIAVFDQSGIFEYDDQMLRRIAYAETQDGNDPSTYSNFNGGIWGLNETKYNETKTNAHNMTQLQEAMPEIFRILGINWLNTTWDDLRKPLYSAIAARLYMLILANYTINIPLGSEVSDQGVYWSRYYTSSNETASDFVDRVTELDKMYLENCHVSNLDLVFILDSSGSVGYNNFQIVKAFTYNITNSFDVDPNHIHVGVITYATNINIQFYLNTYKTKSQVLQAISNLTYTAGATYTHAALDTARTVMFTGSNGARPASQGVPRIVVVVTDGASTSRSSTLTSAAAIHSAGIIAYSVGIANALEAELHAIATKPSYVYLATFDEKLLESVKISISKQACIASPMIQVNYIVSDQVYRAETKYLNFPFLSNVGITIFLNVTNGSAVLYVSSVISTPNKGFYDFTMMTNDFANNCLMAVNLSNQSTVTIYVAVEGIDESNSIHVHASPGDATLEPIVMEELSNDKIIQFYGETVSMTCRATGKPLPVVTWFRNGGIIIQSNIDVTTTAVDNSTVESVITISNITPTDDGHYECVGNNRLPNGTVPARRSFLLEGVAQKIIRRISCEL